MTKTDDLAVFEYTKGQLVTGLGAVAESLRNCATLAENFAKIVKNTPYGSDSAGHYEGVDDVDEKVATGAKRKASAVEEGDGKKKRAPRKPKDPNAPRRPPSSYLLFQNEIRKELKEQFPKMTNSELLQMISTQWAQMTDEQKAKYNEQTATAKEKYNVDKAAYDADSPKDAAVTPAPAPVTIKKVAKAAKAAPVVVEEPEPESADESSEAGSGSSGSDKSDEESEEEEEVPQPPTKKSKTSDKKAAPLPVSAKKPKSKTGK